MNILFVLTGTPEIGGAAVHVRDLAAAMVQRGHDVALAIGTSHPVLEDLQDAGCSIFDVPALRRNLLPWNDLAAVAQLRAVITSWEPDVVACHSSKAGVIGRVAGNLCGVPAVFTAHGWAFTEGVGDLRARVYGMAERRLARLSARVITVSDHDRVLAEHAGITASTEVVRIWNGIPDIPPAMRACPEREPPHLVMLARYSRQKDHDTLIRALAGLTDLPWRCTLAGGGPWFGRVRELVADTGLGNRVAVLGEVDYAQRLLRDAQLAVLSSRWEGLPLTILEAMRAGLPVVASDVGGVREAVLHGETGFVVPREDPDTLSRFLRGIIADPQRRVAMGTAGRARYEAEFTLDGMVEQTLDVYRSAVTDARREATLPTGRPNFSTTPRRTSPTLSNPGK